MLKHEDLNQLILELRKEMGVSLEEFAKTVGLTDKQKVWQIEKGVKPIGFNLFKKVIDNAGYDYFIVVKKKNKKNSK